MKFYTISELEQLSEKEINKIVVERTKICTSLIKKALIGKTIESEMGNKLDDEESITFPIKDITYHNSKDVFINDKHTGFFLNIYFDGYACKTKKEIMYEDESTDYELRTVVEECIAKKARIYWGLRKNQGLDYINMGFLFPTPLINPDVFAYKEYKEYCKLKKSTPSSKEKKKKELENKLASTVEELKDERFNLLQEDHCYVPEDKEELIKFITKANKKTFDKEALIGVVKKHSDNEEIISIVLDGFFEEVFQYASDRLKNDKKFIEKCINNNRVNILEFVGDKFKDDEELMRKAINVSGYIIRAASDRLKNNKELCLIAIENQADAFLVISKKMQRDKDAINKIIETRGDYFCICPEVETNKELLIKAFSTAFDGQSHNLLRNTSEELRNDKEVALAAIKCNPTNIHYIGERLKAEIGDFEPYTYLSKIDLYNEINKDVVEQESIPKKKLKM